MLLVGDVDVMPVRYMVLDRVTPAAFDYAFYPSDLYYADLAKQDGAFDDWNARKDGFHAGYFGEVRGEKNKKDPINYDEVDYRPDIAVGRWPVSTAEEVKTVAAKSIAYEDAVRDGTHPGLRQAALFHVGGWVDARGRIDGLAKKMPDGWKADRYFFDAGDGKFSTPPPDKKHVLAALNQGRFAGGPRRPRQREHLGGLLLRQRHRQGQERRPAAGDVLRRVQHGVLRPAAALRRLRGRGRQGAQGHGRGRGIQGAAAPAVAVPEGQIQPDRPGRASAERRAGRGGGLHRLQHRQPAVRADAAGRLHGGPARVGSACVGDCWAERCRYYYDKEHLDTLKPNDDWYPPSIFFQGMKYVSSATRRCRWRRRRLRSENLVGNGRGRRNPAPTVTGRRNRP